MSLPPTRLPPGGRGRRSLRKTMEAVGSNVRATPRFQRMTEWPTPQALLDAAGGDQRRRFASLGAHPAAEVLLDLHFEVDAHRLS